MKRKGICLLLALVFLLPTGCGRPAAPTETGRTQVTMMYTHLLPRFEALVEETWSDIDLNVERNAEATIDGESERRLHAGHGTDIITTTMPTGDVQNSTLDLSAQPFASRYQGGITQSLLIGGEVHYLPLPGRYSGYIYNATLAEAAGITEPPQSNAELLALFDAAAEKGLGRGEDGYMFAVESADRTAVASYFFGMRIPDFLGLAEGIEWRKALTERRAGFADGMRECLDLIMPMVERGYADPSRLLIRSGNATPALDRMRDGTLLMIYGTADCFDELSRTSEEYTYAMIPFLSDEGNHPWALVAPAAYLAVNTALGEKGNEAKLDAAQRVLDLLSTPEGQAAFIADTGVAQSYLTEAVETGAASLPEGLAECVENGYVYNAQLPAMLLRYFGLEMVEVLEGKITMDEALSAVDDYFINGDEQIESDQTLVGVSAMDMIYEDYNVRREETALGNLIADAVREASGAEMAFVNGGSIRSSLYAGNIFGYDLSAICPYDNTIVVLEVDAETIRAMLANSLTRLGQENGIPGGRFLNVSGLHYRFSYNGGEAGTLLDVTLPDGTPLDGTRRYTIAVTSYMAGALGYLDNNGDGFTMLNVYSDTAPLAESVRIVRETDLTFGDALRQYLAAHRDTAVTAAVEGRIEAVTGDA